MFSLLKKTNNIVSADTFKKNIEDIKLRLDLLEDDIRRIRRKPKKSKDDLDQEEEVTKLLEEDGFKEIRELNKKFGQGAF